MSIGQRKLTRISFSPPFSLQINNIHIRSFFIYLLILELKLNIPWMGLDDMWKGTMLKTSVVFLGCKSTMAWFCFVNNSAWRAWLFKSRANISNAVLYYLNTDTFHLSVFVAFEFPTKLINLSLYRSFVYTTIMD